MTDALSELKHRLRKKDEVIEAQIQKLADAYHRAKTPKAELKALANLARHAGEKRIHGPFDGGASEDWIRFANAMDRIAEKL